MELTLTTATSLLQKHIEKQEKKIKNDEVLNYFNHKIRHTYAVLFDTQRILTYEKELFNTDVLKKKAEIASLLHDIARFYQNNWERILTNKEFEHGDAGYNILKQEWITDLTILLAVKYHNKISLDVLYEDKEYLACSEEKQKEIKLVSQVVRDSDKLQNLEYIIFSDRNDIFLLDKDSKHINKKILDDFFYGKLIRNELVISSADKVLALAAWVFDLHFETTKIFLKQAKFIDFIENKLKWMKVDENILDKVVFKLKEELNDL